VGLLIVPDLYELTLVGSAPAWTGLGQALQAAVTEELWMRSLRSACCGGRSDPSRPSPLPP